MLEKFFLEVVSDVIAEIEDKSFKEEELERLEEFREFLTREVDKKAKEEKKEPKECNCKGCKKERLENYYEKGGITLIGINTNTLILALEESKKVGTSVNKWITGLILEKTLLKALKEEENNG